MGNRIDKTLYYWNCILQFEDEKFDRLFSEIILNLNFAHDRTQEALDKAYFISTYIVCSQVSLCMFNEY